MYQTSIVCSTVLYEVVNGEAMFIEFFFKDFLQRHEVDSLNKWTSHFKPQPRHEKGTDKRARPFQKSFGVWRCSSLFPYLAADTAKEDRCSECICYPVLEFNNEQLVFYYVVI
jgi:hypothetical protein